MVPQGEGLPLLHQNFSGRKRLENLYQTLQLFQRCYLKPPEAALPPSLGPSCVCGFVHRYVTGWFSPYHRRRKLIHPVVVQHIQPQVLR